MSKKQQFRFNVSPTGEAAYLQLPLTRGSERKVTKNIRLYELIGVYSGPDVILDFDAAGRLIGIEVLSDETSATVENEKLQ